MAAIRTPCGKSMTITEFVRHIPRCIKCSMWHMTQRPKKVSA